jgi:hypothetical protein
MSRHKIGAREAVNDIKSGMSDADLMKKYGLSEKGLKLLFEKLVEAKFLEESFVQKHVVAEISMEGAQSEPSPSGVPPAGAANLEDSPELFDAIAKEIKEGLHDAEIMRRHEISPGRLGEIKAKLVESGQVESTHLAASENRPTKTCPFCSQQIRESFSRCPHCGQWLEPVTPLKPDEDPPAATGFRPAAVPGREDIFDEEKECPWEDREGYGTLNAYFQTATRCLLTPTAFFSRLPLRDGYFNPILFAAMTGVVSFVLVYVFVQLFSRSGMGFLGFILGVSFVFVGSLIMVPIGIGIWSAILHGCLYLLGGAHSGYQATFRVVSYSSVTGIFNAIPIVGTIASLWSLVLTIIGLRETHKTSTGTSVAAVLVPLGVVVLIVIFAVTLAGIRIASHLSKGLNQPKPAKVVVSQDYTDWALPPEVCRAVDAYLAAVDAARDLDAESAQAKVQQALAELDQALSPFENRSHIPELKAKARAYGRSLLTKGVLNRTLGVKLDALNPAWERMKEDLKRMCGK